ncbi:MAG: hypothetical protein JWL96_2238 [Sphingomonas bacterium]|uniref:hypothetical protein n=1 Tax=Sphingomonas bacterium TaxID=1895847 RepID=UPI00260618B6|nr:hypothetical protein [Sphingomonas bacterium]MDB5710168.1 hypothetical protein [Sphingomonas bacterium]
MDRAEQVKHFLVGVPNESDLRHKSYHAEMDPEWTMFPFTAAPAGCFIAGLTGDDSMKMSYWLLVSASALGLLAGWRASASETTTYSYNALGGSSPALTTAARTMVLSSGAVSIAPAIA